MRTALATIVIALLVTSASAAFAQDTTGPTDDTPASPVPMPFDEDDNADGGEREKPDAVDQAKLLLSGYHGLPPREVFEENLDQPKMVVLSIALDDDSMTMHRKRALSALGYWKDDGLLRTYTQLLQDASTPEAMRHQLMLLLADHFPDEALGHLKPYLSHKNLQYRLSAIEAIRRLPSPSAQAALKEALASEKSAVAKKRLEQYTQTVR